MIPEPILIALAFLGIGVVELALWIGGCELVRRARRIKP